MGDNMFLVIASPTAPPSPHPKGEGLEMRRQPHKLQFERQFKMFPLFAYIFSTIRLMSGCPSSSGSSVSISLA